MGIVKELMQKYNISSREVRRAIMKAGTAVYKRIKEELGVEKMPRKVRGKILSVALRAAWRIAREEKKIPTPDEVYAAFNEAWPNWRTELQANLATTA